MSTTTSSWKTGQREGNDRFGLFWAQDWSGPLYATESNNRGSGNRYFYPAPEDRFWRFVWDGGRSTLSDFNGTPGEQAGSYLTQPADRRRSSRRPACRSLHERLASTVDRTVATRRVSRRNSTNSGRRGRRWARTTRSGRSSTDSDRRRGRWDLEEFLARGETDVARYEGLLRDAGHTGRLWRRCSTSVAASGACPWHGDAGRTSVTGVDISAPMIERGRIVVASAPNVRLLVNDAVDLGQFPDATFDLAFSHICLQHMPWPLAAGYVAEFGRVTAPGGFVAFQLPSRGPARTSTRRRIVDALPEGVRSRYQTMATRNVRRLRHVLHRPGGRHRSRPVRGPRPAAIRSRMKPPAWVRRGTSTSSVVMADESASDRSRHRDPRSFPDDDADPDQAERDRGAHRVFVAPPRSGS